MSKRNWKFYTGAEFHESTYGERIESFNPTTGKTWANLPQCTEADVEKAASSERATCVLGGGTRHHEFCEGWFIEPTVFTGVTPDMAVARQEIFGPVLAVLRAKDDEEAVAITNHSDFGLAAGIWSNDGARAMRLAHRIGAGTVYINKHFASAPQSPVGGFKASGYGRENGIEGLLSFTQTKSVWLDLDPHQVVPFG